MTASTNKKAIVRRFDRDAVLGFVNPQTYLQAHGLEILTQGGVVQTLPYSDVKSAFFVKEFGEAPGEVRVFNTRPKMQGIWIRMTFRDGDVMDGLIPNNLLQVEAYGFTVVPPNPASSNQKVFVPRAALTDVQVLGVVGSPLKPKARTAVREQIGLFD